MMDVSPEPPWNCVELRGWDFGEGNVMVAQSGLGNSPDVHSDVTYTMILTVRINLHPNTGRRASDTLKTSSACTTQRGKGPGARGGPSSLNSRRRTWSADLTHFGRLTFPQRAGHCKGFLTVNPSLLQIFTENVSMYYLGKNSKFKTLK